MKKIISIIALIIVIVIAFVFLSKGGTKAPQGSTGTPVAGLGEHCGGNMTNAPMCGAGLSCTPAPGSHLPFGDVGGICAASSTPSASTTPALDQSVSDGVVSFAYPSGDFGLATIESQITVSSYIPPCGPNFNYCLYHIGSEYKGTNFESAGLRIQRRGDFATESRCLDTAPDGFDSSIKPNSIKSGDNYSSSVFSNVGDAGAGHYASGSLYRLYIYSNSSCYEFETRIGQTQFANYPAGTIQQFTDAEMAYVRSELDAVLASVSLSSGEKNLFPVAIASTSAQR